MIYRRWRSGPAGIPALAICSSLGLWRGECHHKKVQKKEAQPFRLGGKPSIAEGQGGGQFISSFQRHTSIVASSGMSLLPRRHIYPAPRNPKSFSHHAGRQCACRVADFFRPGGISAAVRRRDVNPLSRPGFANGLLHFAREACTKLNALICRVLTYEVEQVFQCGHIRFLPKTPMPDSKRAFHCGRSGRRTV